MSATTARDVFKSGGQLMRFFISGTVWLAAAILTVGSGLDRVQAARPTFRIPVSVRFTDVFPDQTLPNILSDGSGAYQDTQGNGVIAYISPDGATGNDDRAFHLATGDDRGLRFFFTSCWLGPCSNPFPTGSGTATALIAAAPRNPDGTPVPNGLLGMAPGQKLPAFLKINLKGIPDEWTLCMKLDGTDGGICGSSVSATWGRITRTSLPEWEISGAVDPDALGTRSDLATLLTRTVNGKKQVITFRGTYSMPFRFTVTCVNVADCPWQQG